MNAIGRCGRFRFYFDKILHDVSFPLSLSLVFLLFYFFLIPFSHRARAKCCVAFFFCLFTLWTHESVVSPLIIPISEEKERSQNNEEERHECETAAVAAATKTGEIISSETGPTKLYSPFVVFAFFCNRFDVDDCVNHLRIFLNFAQFFAVNSKDPFANRANFTIAFSFVCYVWLYCCVFCLLQTLIWMSDALTKRKHSYVEKFEETFTIAIMMRIFPLSQLQRDQHHTHVCVHEKETLAKRKLK